MFGLLGGLVGGLADVWAHPIATSAGATPRSVYRADLRTQTVVGLGVGLTFGLGGGLVVGLVGGLVVGLVDGLVVGLVVGLVGGAAPSLWMLEVLFRLRGRRVRFLPLLETASERQMLRQAGAVYQFRHAELQDRLATR